MNIAVCRMPELTDAERADLGALSRAVYPPEEAAAWAGRNLEWAAAESGVFVRDVDGRLVSFAGLVFRAAAHEGHPVGVGGIGGVKTHPEVRRQGFAGQAMRRAVEHFSQSDVGFALLVCGPHLLGYYRGLGWQEFSGRLLVTQHGKVAEFTFNRVMVCGVRGTAPAGGTIDLLGPPW